MLGRRSFLEALAAAAALPDSLASAASVKSAARPATDFFPGFRRLSVHTTGTDINVMIGGQGPPLLLLHGYPQTHIEWRKVAPELAKTHTVVLADLRGYGDSGKPIGGPDHAAYSKRAMAADQAEVMSALGFRRFDMIAHDRGARLAHRLLLDHPDSVTRAILIDICPTAYMYEHADRAFGSAYFHWFFLIQDAPLPERLIGNNADAWLRYAFDPAIPDHIEPAAYAEYLRCFAHPAAIHATCEDYRAAASIDLEHDKADQGRKIACPLHVLWGSRGFVGRTYDVLGVWRGFADDVSGNAIESGHWIAEEAPGDLLREAQQFLI
jgi:haloacetate dehalogenase